MVRLTASQLDQRPGAEQMLEIVGQLAAELRRGTRARIALDSHLERDVGLDSLARVELIARIEHAFGAYLPEKVLTTAETPRDFLRALAAAHAVPPSQAVAAPAVAPAGTIAAPAQAQTLNEALEAHARTNPERAHIHLVTETLAEEVITYAALRAGALRVAGGLLARGLEPGQSVALMLPTSREYFFAFFGVLLAGGVPVPIYPPLRPAQLEEHLRRHARILDNARATLLITLPEARGAAWLLRAMLPRLRAVATVAELAAGTGIPAPFVAHPQDIAFLQYTSGSTGNPKGVILTHANLLANIRAMGEAVEASSADIFVSWMPLYHDMGLIGAWLGSLYYGMRLVVMSPLTFLAHPKEWLWAIHRHRATLSGCPNFGYELCLRHVMDHDREGLDLSSWRLAFNGAEAVSPDTITRFTECFAPCGFRPEAMLPVYGLAENSVGLAFPPLGRAPVIDCIERDAFLHTGRAIPASPADKQALRFVACGRALPAHAIRVVDATGFELTERVEGRLEFQGPSATSGYFRNAPETERLFRGEWLDSGDRAYVADGEVYITGRVKDIIIRAGRNLYPDEIEQALGNIAGIRKGCVAVFGRHDAARGTEQLIVLAETHAADMPTHERLRREINAVVSDLTRGAPDDVVLAAPHTVLKTSSGKIRRAASRDLYEKGRIGERRPLLWQFARLVGAGLALRWRRTPRVAADLFFAAYAWLVFWLLAPLTWAAVALVPRPRVNRRLIRAMARLFLFLTATPLGVQGRDRLPREPHVLVANHASYIDGIIVCAALPPSFSYVAKRELLDQLIARVFLKHLGAEFVERVEVARSAEDARRLALAAQAGRSLLFFPEGTFRRTPGLLTFHMGAFLAAAEAGVAVVPVALRGTRTILRDGQWFPRRGAISVTIGAPIMPAGRDWAAAMLLRNAARAYILSHAREPDLANEPVASMP